MAKSFSSRMVALGDRISRNFEQTMKEATLDGTEAAVMHTPVKTGTARTNWKVSFGKPNTTLIEGPGTADRNVNRETASARALISAANKVKGYKFGRSGDVYITNPVHYILDLDRGTSRQAMEGMSIFAIAAIKARLRKGRLLRGN